MMQRAQARTGYVCSADEEQEASEAFMAWAQSLGLRATVARTVATDGRVIWLLHIDTGRGKLTAHVRDPRDWCAEVKALGLPTDTVPAEWATWDGVTST